MRVRVIAIALTLAAAGCVADEPEPVSVSQYPVSVSQYSDAWAAAWSTADPAAIVPFYDPGLLVRVAQPDHETRLNAGFTITRRGGAGMGWLINWITYQMHPHSRVVDVLVVDDL